MDSKNPMAGRRQKSQLFRRDRRQRVKYITVLPSLVTLINGLCGFAAIVYASKEPDARPVEVSHFAMAGYLVLVAMVADMLDGRLARMSQSTSSFGGQLDSLCDLISFGVAPAFLMLKLTGQTLALPSVLSGNVVHRFIWLAALVYISCTAIRLARFNVENDENEASHMSFAGLPSPAAAGVLVSLVIFHQEQFPQVSLLVYLLPFCALGAGILMVSRIRYPHVLNQYLRGKQPLSYLIGVLFFLGIIICVKQTALVLAFGAYASGSFVKWAYLKLVHPKDRPVSLDEPLAAGDSNSPRVDPWGHSEGR